MLSPRMITRSAALATLGVAAACSDTTTPDLVDVEFGIQRAGSVGALVTGPLFATSGEATAISPDTIASLSVTIERIQVLPLVSDAVDEEEAAWTTIPLDEAITIDLTTLPTTDESPLSLASGTLTEGGYTDVRLFVSDASIMFKGPISLGSGISFEQDQPYVVTIPSGNQTGIKTDMAFNAVANTQVILVFDEDASYTNVTLASNEVVILAPVIRAPGNNGS